MYQELFMNNLANAVFLLLKTAYHHQPGRSLGTIESSNVGEEYAVAVRQHRETA